MSKRAFTDEFIKQLKEGNYYNGKLGLLINAKINLIFRFDDNTLNICFDGGVVDMYKSKIEKVDRPGSILSDKEFEWCYMLKNNFDEVIGYIGKVIR